MDHDDSDVCDLCHREIDRDDEWPMALCRECGGMYCQLCASVAAGLCKTCYDKLKGTEDARYECIWTYDEDDEVWDASCGHWADDHPPPAVCPHCDKPIRCADEEIDDDDDKT